MITNLWQRSHSDQCRECERYCSVDQRGRCESCANNTYCAVEGCVNLAHVCSDDQQCSKCELAGAVASCDVEGIAQWTPLVAADRTLWVDTPVGAVPQNFYLEVYGRAA